MESAGFSRPAYSGIEMDAIVTLIAELINRPELCNGRPLMVSFDTRELMFEVLSRLSFEETDSLNILNDKLIEIHPIMLPELPEPPSVFRQMRVTCI